MTVACLNRLDFISYPPVFLWIGPARLGQNMLVQGLIENFKNTSPCPSCKVFVDIGSDSAIPRREIKPVI